MPRAKRVKARTESAPRLRRIIDTSALNDSGPDASEMVRRPRTRAECGDLGEALNPCPFLSCAYHLAIDVDEDTGSIKYNHPGKELWELEATCALRVAERGGLSNADVGKVLNVVREAAGTIISKSLDTLRVHLPVVYHEYVAGDVTRGIEPESEDVSAVKQALVGFLKTNDVTYGDDAETPVFAARPERRTRRRAGVWR